MLCTVYAQVCLLFELQLCTKHPQMITVVVVVDVVVVVVVDVVVVDVVVVDVVVVLVEYV